MTRFRIFSAALAIGALVAITHPVNGQAAPAQQPDAKAQQAQMMDMQKMMADMKAMDARLDALVTKMNAAKGEARVNAMADLLMALVQERRTMGGMMQMHGQMMGQMMQMQGDMMKRMGGAR